MGRRGRTLHLMVAVALAYATLPGGPSEAARRCKTPPTKTSSAQIVCGLELERVTSITREGGVGSIAVSGKLAAVLQRDEGTVALLDLKNPARPKVVGRYEDPAPTSLDGDIAFSKDGKYLFYARQTRDFAKEGIHVLNVEDPSAPTLVSYAPAGGSLRVAYHHDGEAEWVVLLDAITGLVVYRFERTTGQLVPVHVDALPALKVGGPISGGLVVDPKDGATEGPLLYVTTGRTGLQVFDFSNPAVPVELGSWTEETGLASIAVASARRSRTVYVATEYWFDKTRKPQVIELDARDLGAIEVKRRLSFGAPPDDLWRVQEIALAGSELYVAHSHLGLLVLDGRGRVARIARVPGSTAVEPPVVAPYAYGVAPVGRRAYVTDAGSGLLWTLRR